MAELMERAELSEQVMSPELRQELAKNYMEFSREAAKSGHTDMAEYYMEKAYEMNSGGRLSTDQSPAAEQQSPAGTDMQAYYEAKKQRLQDELEQRQQQWRMDKAIHGVPDYAGLGGWREYEYLYEAEKEYNQNGNSTEFNRLMEGAANAHVREKYDPILK